MTSAALDWYRPVAYWKVFIKEKAEALLREKIGVDYGQIRLILYGGIWLQKGRTRFSQNREEQEKI